MNESRDTMKEEDAEHQSQLFSIIEQKKINIEKSEMQETENYSYATAPAGGIIVSYNQKSDYVNIFNSKLKQITKISLNKKSLNDRYVTNSTIFYIGITGEEIIVVLLKNMALMFLNVLGHLIALVRPEKHFEVRKALLRENSLIALTDKDLWFMANIRTPAWTNMALPCVEKFDFFVPEHEPKLPYILAVNNKQKACVIFGEKTKTLNIPERVINIALYDGVSTVKFAVLAEDGNNNHIVYFINFKSPQNGVRVCLSDSKKEVRNFLWMGENYVIVMYQDHGIAVSMSDSSCVSVELPESSVVVQEVDGLRFISPESHIFLHSIHKSICEFFAPDEQFLTEFRNWKGDGGMGRIGNDNSAEAMALGLTVVSHMINSKHQAELLNMICYGRAFLNSHQIPESDNLAVVLRIINSVNEGKCGDDKVLCRRAMDITYQQMKKIGYQCFLMRLCNRGLHSWAKKFASMLGQDVSAINTHYVYTYHLTDLYSARSGSEKKEKKLDGVHYGSVARALFRTMKDVRGKENHSKGNGSAENRQKSVESVVEDLLRKEDIDRIAIPVCLLLKQYDKAVERAVNIGDPALIQEVLEMRIRDRKNTSEKLSDKVQECLQKQVAENIHNASRHILMFRLASSSMDVIMSYIFHIFKTNNVFDPDIQAVIGKVLLGEKKDEKKSEKKDDALLEKDVFDKFCEFLNTMKAASEATEPPERAMTAGTTVFQVIEKLLESSYLREAEELAKKMAISDERFAWLRINFYLKNNKHDEIIKMKDIMTKSPNMAFLVFKKCMKMVAKDKSWLEVAAGLIGSMSDQDQEEAMSALEDHLNECEFGGF